MSFSHLHNQMLIPQIPTCRILTINPRHLGLFTGNNIMDVHLVMCISNICVNWSMIRRLKALDTLFRLALIRICDPVEGTTTPVVKLKYLLVGGRYLQLEVGVKEK